MKEITKWSAPIFGLFGIILAIIFGNNLTWIIIPFSDNLLDQAGKVAGTLFVVAVFLERGLAVLNNLIFGEESVDLETRLLASINARPRALDGEKLTAFWEVRALEDSKQRLRLGVGFIIATLVASAGVRTLTALLNIESIHGDQRILLNIMDILLTAGLLAGGSNGIAAIIDLLRKRGVSAKLRAMLEDMGFRSPADSKREARLRRAGLWAPTPHVLEPRLAEYVESNIPFSFEHDLSNLSEVTLLGKDITSLDLAEHAKSAAEKLKKDFPAVIFTSGRRTVSEQANAMAGNIVNNRQWIAETYAVSDERDALQTWVDDNPNATTKAAIAAGLAEIMNNWSDAKRVKLSRHFAGLAFDIQPADDKLKEAIKSLPNLVKFLDSEGGLTIWHAEFKSK